MASSECDSDDNSDAIRTAAISLGSLNDELGINVNEVDMELQLRSESTPMGEQSTISNRRNKRERTKDEEEIWTRIGRGGKKIALSADDDGTIVAEELLEISLTCDEKLPKQIGLARLLKQENIQDIIKVKYVNSYKAIIQFNKDESAEGLINNQNLIKKGFRCHRTMEINKSYGVIKDVELDLSDEEILNCLKSDTEIIAVKRLKRRNSEEGQWESSEAIRLCFNSSTLPSYIYIFNTRVVVVPYLFPVTQCSKCWRFGHSLKMCPSLKPICPKCGKHHANCETMVFKCVNCSGKHMALSKVCPIFHKERRIRELMAELNCSYRKAMTIYVPPEEPTEIMSQDESFPQLKHSDPSTTREPQLTIPSSSRRPYSEVLKDQSRASAPSAQSRADSVSPTFTDNNSGNGSQTFTRKTPRSQPSKNKNKKKQNRNNTKWEEEFSEPESESQEPRIISASLLELFKKVKEIIWSKRQVSIEDKIKSCLSTIWDWLCNSVVSYISDLPVFNLLFKKHSEQQ